MSTTMRAASAQPLASRCARRRAIRSARRASLRLRRSRLRFVRAIASPRLSAAVMLPPSEDKDREKERAAQEDDARDVRPGDVNRDSEDGELHVPHPSHGSGASKPSAIARAQSPDPRAHAAEVERLRVEGPERTSAIEAVVRRVPVVLTLVTPQPPHPHVMVKYTIPGIVLESCARRSVVHNVTWLRVGFTCAGHRLKVKRDSSKRASCASRVRPHYHSQFGLERARPQARKTSAARFAQGCEAHPREHGEELERPGVSTNHLPLERSMKPRPRHRRQISAARDPRLCTQGKRRRRIARASSRRPSRRPGER